ncbi:NADH:flavin oxidoreductase/NADH oxidase [Pigmentiphaga soli]|uniref:NADH:flavin oxidoreductase/NADH oxidase n=1 Tax=Pigmentiphaga soli TaxID=1007095 RepID=A0ABP8GEQ5_9BURK
MERSSPLLFSPLTIRSVTLPNRVMVSPMAQYSAVGGMVTDWHFAHFAKFAMGGAGLVFTEATKPERRGLGTVGDMGIWSDEHVAPLRRITDFLRAHGSVPAIQLNHAGRKAGTLKPWHGFGPLDRSVPVEGQAHWEVIAPSAVEYLPGWPLPREMTQADIDTVIEAWAAAARRALAAGFDVVEIHGAHGYLIHQFLSPASNRRGDRYGGSLANRMRFALEVTEAVRAAWPDDKPLFFRVSAVDEGGWTLDDTVALARELKTRGVDLVDCSASGIAIRSPTSSRRVSRLGFQVPYAERVRRDAGIATAAVGLILHARQAEAILADGRADLVAIGRELLYDPFWPAHAAQELGADPGFAMMPTQYGWWLDRRVKTGWPPVAEEEEGR